MFKILSFFTFTKKFHDADPNEKKIVAPKKFLKQKISFLRYRDKKASIIWQFLCKCCIQFRSVVPKVSFSFVKLYSKLQQKWQSVKHTEFSFAYNFLRKFLKILQTIFEIFTKHTEKFSRISSKLARSIFKISS